ncbi:hypothetical protein QQX98_000513 [Neonectria punicea]|uniref:Uncharacterized protein n=1 Tax=Neonectria punicea TaxID=979145 RepID=A0ABR1HSP4_9HYPO
MEEQAIARVLRMGQSQTVTIVKYITEKIVEKNIVKLQEKKSRIAKISLDSTDGDATGLLDDLKFWTRCRKWKSLLDSSPNEKL